MKRQPHGINVFVLDKRHGKSFAPHASVLQKKYKCKSKFGNIDNGKAKTNVSSLPHLFQTAG